MENLVDGVDSGSVSGVTADGVGNVTINGKKVKPREEGELLRYDFHPDGKKEIRWIGGEERDIPLDLEIPGEIPRKFKDIHRKTLMAIYYSGIDAYAAGRRVGFFQDELVTKMGLDKAAIKDLIKWGYCDWVMADIRLKDGTQLGGRKLVAASVQGRSLMRTIEDAMASVTQDSSGEQNANL